MEYFKKFDEERNKYVMILRLKFGETLLVLDSEMFATPNVSISTMWNKFFWWGMFSRSEKFRFWRISEDTPKLSTLDLNFIQGAHQFLDVVKVEQGRDLVLVHGLLAAFSEQLQRKLYVRSPMKNIVLNRLFFEEISGDGVVVLNFPANVERKVLNSPLKTIAIPVYQLLAYQKSLSLETEVISGVLHYIFSGEGSVWQKKNFVPTGLQRLFSQKNVFRGRGMVHSN